MRIGILSDTHDQTERTRAAVGILQQAGAEQLIHCGDIIEPEILQVCSVLPLHFVFGNNDADTVPHLRSMAEELEVNCLGWKGILELGGKRIGVAHGHLTGDLREVRAGNPHYLLTGHSHIPLDRREGEIRRINPGALHRAKRFSVALLDTETETLTFLPVPREPAR